jgi:hypothetical protein
MFAQSLMGQMVITLQKKAKDILSQSSYTGITLANQQSTTSTYVSAGAVIGFSGIINQQNDELATIGPPLLAKKYEIKNFISGVGFGPVTGHNSYGYIEKKYPIINPLSPSDLVRNKVIRMRFFKKLNHENSMVDDYLNPMNPIPEGERILLVLSSLENVINIVLANETY